jgi:glycosyltransferase involved in cell wall biosynthesis
MKSTVVIITDKVEYQSRLRNIVHTLMNNNYNVTILSGDAQYVKDYYEYRNVRVVNLPILYTQYKIISLVSQFVFNFQVYKNMQLIDYDFILCYNTIGLMAGASSKIMTKNKVLVYDSLELSVERYTGFKKKVWGFIQKICLRYCDKIIQAESNRLKYFQQLYNIPITKMVLLENYPLKKHSSGKNKRSPVDMVRVIYLGFIWGNRGYEELIHSFSLLNSNITLDIVGPGDEKYISYFKDIIYSKNISNVKILPAISPDEINEYLSNYDIGIFFYKNSNLNNYYCASTKMYNYINAGLAVISYNYPGIFDVIVKNKIGFCVNEITAEEIETAILTITNDNYLANITPELINTFSWEYQEHQLLSIFQNRTPQS